MCIQSSKCSDHDNEKNYYVLRDNDYDRICDGEIMNDDDEDKANRTYDDDKDFADINNSKMFPINVVIGVLHR